MNTKDLMTAMNWRYATQKFDPSKKLEDHQLDTLKESLRLAPSSSGVQGRGFVIVENPEIRQELLPYARNQRQIVEASHLIVLCRRTDVDEKFIDNFVADTANKRNITIESLEGMKNMIWGGMVSQSEDQKAQWLSKQVYIALGTLLTSCAVLGIDASPMEGFDTTKFDEILGLSEHNLASCVIAAVGFRSEDDKYADSPKVRFSQDKVIVIK